ncbi:SRPBCC family protein [Gluconacetobacter takamatsuzukensis]|uniref:SRPBCC family protein n=1 Tax=Gluconacetobacter takamatsuzukensis TaxID=1286190 RepID=A0A7W4KGJ2_9PROT|nr:SRPBCC family protein [Gluconacetobacter takamatsuzukensis]MBB2206548.1 SRPBCC family protein [Gluconacetobacter takamatsuzukensis]
METDRIEKTVILKATLERVWRAISESGRFGQWFGVEIDGPFVAGQEAIGRVVPTQVDPEVARLQEPHRGAAWRVRIERIEPMRLFSFRWHPFAVDPAQDHAAEPMTLVTFALAEVEGGIRLTITETGFDRLPLARRPQAFRANEGGWAHQARLIGTYLALRED